MFVEGGKPFVNKGGSRSLLREGSHWSLRKPFIVKGGSHSLREGSCSSTLRGGAFVIEGGELCIIEEAVCR
jgi:hypothetical protein